MPRVYGVQDDDQKVSGWMSEDDTVSPPTGETAVLESTIRAADPPGAEGRIQSGGKWDGTSYTAPVGDEFYQPYDTSTELGELQAAAVLAHDALVDWEGQADSIGHLKPTALRATVHDFLVWAHPGLAKVCLSTHWTLAQRIKVCEETVSGPADVTDIYDFYDVADAVQATAVPTSPVLFANPGSLARIPLGTCVSETAETDITDNWAATPDADKLFNARWVDDITA